MSNNEPVEGWRKIMLGDKEVKIVTCKECEGSGFSKPGTGYDSVCDNCGGLGEHPDY